jgi:heme/copper-type cytochrome/quinol oxidase subunit 3
MRETRIVADVAGLPSNTFGHRSMMWWGTLGYLAIEGTTLVISAGSYFYLRRNFPTWPPEHVLRPGLTAAAVQAVLMIVSNAPMVIVDRAARRLDLRTVRIGMVICSLLAVVMCVVRAFEFGALHVRWDTNAYGSAAWATLVTHSTLLLLETIESLVFTLLLFSPSMEQRDLSAAVDNAVYWYFMTIAWLPLAAIVFLSPYLT